MRKNTVSALFLEWHNSKNKQENSPFSKKQTKHKNVLFSFKKGETNSFFLSATMRTWNSGLNLVVCYSIQPNGLRSPTFFYFSVIH